AHQMRVLQVASYPFPLTIPKFLGTIPQKYRPRSGSPATAFQTWIDEIARVVSESLAPKLRGIGMVLPEDVYRKQGMGSDYCLATIADFNSLIAWSQAESTPVFALTSNQIKQGGAVLQRTEESRDGFQQVFSDLTIKIIGLTSSATGS